MMQNDAAVTVMSNISFLVPDKSMLDFTKSILADKHNDIQYQYNSIDTAETTVLRAYTDGANIILGGTVTAQLCAKHGIPCTLITMGKEGILQAALEAKRIKYALQLDKIKRGLLSTVLDYAYEGIITME